jgi:uncharacterized caspase-like protein
MRRLARLAAVASLLLLLAGAAAAERVALVAGASAYEHGVSLANGVRDAEAMAAALRRLGWRVQMLRDPRRVDLDIGLMWLARAAAGAEAALFFWAGHAVEVSGRNLLIGTDARIERPAHWRGRGLDVQKVLDATASAATALVILDGCRAEMLSGRWVGGASSLGARGPGRVAAAPGRLLVFSTASLALAADATAPGQRHSPFTAALLRHIETPGLEVMAMLPLVRREVLAATGGQQVPWESSSLAGPFHFAAERAAR